MDNHKKYLESLIQRTLSFKGRFFLIHCDYNLPLSMNIDSSDWVIKYLTPFDTIILGSDATTTDFEFCKSTSAQIIFVSDQIDQKYINQGLVDLIVHK